MTIPHIQAASLQYPLYTQGLQIEDQSPSQPLRVLLSAHDNIITHIRSQNYQILAAYRETSVQIGDRCGRFFGR